MRSSSGEGATWNNRVSSSKPFNGYCFVVCWTWTYNLSELSIFCTYWSDILRKGNAYAWFVTNRLYSRVVVKRAWRWITSNGFFTIIPNRKFRGISFIRTWAILPKTFSVPIIFLRPWHLRCVTQDRLSFLSAHGCIGILFQIPDMINIISSWSIIYRRKDRWSIIIKFNGYRLLSSTNWSRNLVLLWPRTHILRYFGINVAVSLLSLTDMVLRASWHLWTNIILSWSWSSPLLRNRNSGVNRSLL